MANFLENLLPTAGSILGGIGGAAAGAVAAPFTGGIINPIDAGIAGAGLGGTAGRMGENALTGQKVLQGNDITSGLEGAAGQGAGEAIGGGLGLLGNVLGKGAKGAATGLLKGQFANGSLDNETLGALREMGLSDARGIQPIAQTATGTGGALNEGVLRGLDDNATLADLSHIQPTAQSLIGNEGNALEGNSGSNILQNVQNTFKASLNPDQVTQIAARRGNALTAFEPGATTNMSAKQALNISKSFDQQASIASNAGYDAGGRIVNADQAAKSRIYSQLSDAVKDTFSGTPLVEENKAQIISDLEPLKMTNPQAYNYLVGKVGSASTVSDLRTIQKPLVRASQAFKQTTNAADKAPGLSAKGVTGLGLAGVGAATAGPVGAVPGALMLAAQHPGAERVGATTLDRIGNILTNPTMKDAVKNASRVTGDVAGNIPGYDTSNPQGVQAMQNTAATLPNQAATAASPEALQMMLGLIGLQTDPYMASSFAPMISGAAQPLQKAGAAQNALEGLMGTYGQAGGGQGGAEGLLARLKAMVPGTAGNLYNRQAGQLEQNLQGLGVPGTVAPSLMSGGGAAGSGFGTIQQIIDALGGNPQSVLSGIPAGV